MNYSVIIVAAGSGARMNLGYNKMYYSIDGNQTILEKTVGVFLRDEECTQIIVVTNGGEYYQKIGQYCGKIVIAEGGKTRQESVYNGLFAVKEEVVFVHDGARPFLSLDCISRLKDKMEIADAAFLGVYSKDTIKVIEAGQVERTLPRSNLIQAQTPQAFKTSLLMSCYEKALLSNLEMTDDASVVEAMSDTPVFFVEGDYNNYKITTKEDLRINQDEK